MTSLTLYTIGIAAVGVERLGELALSQRNAARAFARGAVEVGQAHYRVMTVLHTLFLVSCVVEPRFLDRPPPGALSWLFVVLALASQALRYWAIATLGERWNTRVIVLPGAPPVTGGPYRLMKHPNYLAVIVELAVLPMIHGAWMTALVFSIANGLLLAVRIRSEEAALGQTWAAAFADRRRFLLPERDTLTNLDDEVLAELRSIAAKELEYEGPMEPSMSLSADLRLDSMAMIVVAVGLENRFRVRLEEEDAGALDTVGDLVALVCRRVAEKTS